MRDLIEDAPMKGPVIQDGLRYGTTQLNLSGPYTIPPTKNFPVYIGVSLTGAQTITLPPIVGAVIPMEGRYMRFVNSSGSAVAITLARDAADGGGTLGTVAQNASAEVFVVNGVWVQK